MAGPVRPKAGIFTDKTRQPQARDASEGKGPQRRPRKRLDRRLEEVSKAVGGGYCRLQMPLKPALGVRGTVAGRGLDALEGGSPPTSNGSPRLYCNGSGGVRNPQVCAPKTMARINSSFRKMSFFHRIKHPGPEGGWSRRGGDPPPTGVSHCYTPLRQPPASFCAVCRGTVLGHALRNRPRSGRKVSFEGSSVGFGLGLGDVYAEGERSAQAGALPVPQGRALEHWWMPCCRRGALTSRNGLGGVAKKDHLSWWLAELHDRAAADAIYGPKSLRKG